MSLKKAQLKQKLDDSHQACKHGGATEQLTLPKFSKNYQNPTNCYFLGTTSFNNLAPENFSWLCP